MGYKDEECKGCRSHNTYNCAIRPNCNLLECPCLTCLIKGMCRVDCEKVDTYIKEALEYGCTYNSHHPQFYGCKKEFKNELQR